jgi:hypothetical protein
MRYERSPVDFAPPAALPPIGLREWLRGAAPADSAKWTHSIAVAVVSSPSDKRANLAVTGATAERIRRERSDVRLIMR